MKIIEWRVTESNMDEWGLSSTPRSWAPVFAHPRPQLIEHFKRGQLVVRWSLWFLTLLLFGEAVFHRFQ